MSGDMIEMLPSDDTVLTHNEVQLMEYMFQNHHNRLQGMMKELQDVVLLLLLFMLISLPQVDDQLAKVAPLAGNSVYIMILIKGVLFAFLYFVLKNLYLVRKSN